MLLSYVRGRNSSPWVRPGYINMKLDWNRQRGPSPVVWWWLDLLHHKAHLDIEDVLGLWQELYNTIVLVSFGTVSEALFPLDYCLLLIFLLFCSLSVEAFI